MNLNKHEKKYKDYLALKREYDDLYKQKWAITPIKLDKPIAHGYIRYLQIRPEYRLRGDYKQIKSAFEMVGYSKAYCKNKSFIIKHKKHTQELHAKLKFILDPRFKYYISEKKQLLEYEQIYNCGGHLKHVDNIVTCDCCFSKDPRHFKPHYEFTKPWLLEEKTEINWFTHYTPIDTEVETKIAKIKQKMYDNHIWEKLYGGYHDDYGKDYAFLKDKTHGYLHGYPRPRIDELYEWTEETRLD